MKICLVGPGDKTGGGVREYIKNVIAYSHHKIIFIPSNSIGVSIPRKLVDLFIMYLRFTWVIAFDKITLVHINPSLGSTALMRDALFTIISKIFFKKVLIQWHGWNPASEYLLTKFKGVLRFSLWEADQINILNPNIISNLRGFGFKNKIFVTKTFVDDELLNMRSTKKRGNIDTLLFLSRISKNKGIFEAIEAFEQVLKKRRELKLIIAGDGPDLRLVKDSISPNLKDKITFTGHVTGPFKERIFKHSDIYIFPSYYEGMPISLLEAMGFGLAVICNNVGAIPTFFENEKMGFMINNLNPQNYASKIEYLISNPGITKSISLYNIAYIKKNHLASNHISELDRIYNSIINGG